MPDGFITLHDATDQVGSVDGRGSNIHQDVTGRSLFAFTVKKDLLILLPALILTITSGAAKPLATIFVGKILNDMGTFGAGQTTSSELLQTAKDWCLAITALGVASIFFNGGFFALWLVFGEKQAKHARDNLFASMLKKDMEWYDLCTDGVGSLLIRMQT
jgi:ATP-binding cassette subfamily B (MDR/TAP) protein 1